MAISLNDINKKSEESDSLLDVILKRKELKSKLKQKGRKATIQRPWEVESQLVTKRVKKSKVMKPFVKSNPITESQLLREITRKAKSLFSNVDLSDL